MLCARRTAMRGFATSATDVVGFIGLGNMGSRMAPNLIKNGRQVVGFDVSGAAVKELVEAGGSAAATPAEVAAQATTIITMLPNPALVKQVFYGDNGIFSTSLPGTLFIDSSTIDPNTCKEVNASALEHGNSNFLDAPVSGGVGGAEAGTLTFMVGADSEEAYAQAQGVLQDMGKNIVRCGGVGTGQVAKMCNNLALAIQMIGTSEAMLLGQAMGMDPKVLAGIMNTSTARCWSSDTYNPSPGVMEGVPSSRGYTGGFGVDLMLKDLGLATDAGKLVKSPLPLGALSQQLYALTSAKGNGGKDFSSIFEFLQKEQ